METGAQSSGWHDAILPGDSWRHPGSEWDLDVLLDVLGSLRESSEPGELARALIQRIAPPHSLSEVDQVRVDAFGALRRPPGAAMDSDLLGWVAACVWGASGVRERLREGHTVTRLRVDEDGARGHVCIPLRAGRLGQTLIACMVVAPSIDAARRLACRLTLLTHLITDSVWENDSPRDTTVEASPTAMTLTSRQREILRGMAAGMTNRQIAHRIAFSESTVRLESIAIYRHFGVHSRFQAVAAAREAGMLREAVVTVGA